MNYISVRIKLSSYVFHSYCYCAWLTAYWKQSTLVLRNGYIVGHTSLRVRCQRVMLRKRARLHRQPGDHLPSWIMPHRVQHRPARAAHPDGFGELETRHGACDHAQPALRRRG